LSVPAPILIVDDEAEIRDMLATLLTLEGHAVLTASDGRTALDLARAHRPSLIILDLMMPIMSGEAFRAAQVADASIAEIPVLVISARHDGDAVAHRLHAVGCLTKPVDFEALGAYVDAWGSRR
jgi:DNA-binding response OmpR family regulator